MFWTFGTLDYYRPGEIPNVHYLHEEVHKYEEEHAAAQAAGADGQAEEAPAGDAHGSLLLTGAGRCREGRRGWCGLPAGAA